MGIFDEQNDTVTMDDSVDYLAELVGEGKKFTDEKALAKGKAEADRYIELLKSRLDEATKELNTRASLSTFLEEIKKTKEPQQQVATPAVPKPELDDSSLEERLEQMIAKRESRSKATSNLEQVQNVLKDTYGADANVIVKKKANDLGIGLDKLEAIASESPTAFLRLLGVEQKETYNPVVPRNSLTQTSPNMSGVKNKKYFDTLKQKDPVTYRNPKTTVEMIKAMKECTAKGIPWE